MSRRRKKDDLKELARQHLENVRAMMKLLTADLVLKECAGLIINNHRGQQRQPHARPVPRVKLESDPERRFVFRHLESIRKMMELLSTDAILWNCAGRIITDHRKQQGENR